MNTAKAKKAEQARKALGDIPAELAALDGMSHQELCAKYLEVFGEPTKSRNKEFLRKKIGIRLQQKAEGDPQVAIREQALAVHAKAPIQLKPSQPRQKKEPVSGEAAPAPAKPVKDRDPRLPPAGTVLKKTHKGVEHEVKVLEQGFEYRGETYRSLSKIAKVITHTNWNGFLYFGLAGRAETTGARS